MKKPNECKNIHDIRNEIDGIDKEIISLIAQRAKYVSAAAKFKKDQQSVKAPDRVKEMLEKRAMWAEKKNLDPEIIKKIYTLLVQFFIKEEMNQLKNNNR